MAIIKMSETRILKSDKMSAEKLETAKPHLDKCIKSIQSFNDWYEVNWSDYKNFNSYVTLTRTIINGLQSNPNIIARKSPTGLTYEYKWIREEEKEKLGFKAFASREIDDGAASDLNLIIHIDDVKKAGLILYDIYTVMQYCVSSAPRENWFFLKVPDIAEKSRQSYRNILGSIELLQDKEVMRVENVDLMTRGGKSKTYSLAAYTYSPGSLNDMRMDNIKSVAKELAELKTGIKFFDEEVEEEPVEVIEEDNDTEQTSFTADIYGNEEYPMSEETSIYHSLTLEELQQHICNIAKAADEAASEMARIMQDEMNCSNEDFREKIFTMSDFCRREMLTTKYETIKIIEDALLANRVLMNPKAKKKMINDIKQSFDAKADNMEKFIKNMANASEEPL